MQTNTPYIVPLDQNSRNPISISQPILTRSLPSVAASVAMPLDNVMVSGIYQSYVQSPANLIGTQSRAPMTVICGIGDGNFSQKQSQIPNCFQNQLPIRKYSPPIMSMAGSLSGQQQSTYSTVIPSAKILDKPKKKSKSRMKTKYLLKIIKIEENCNRGETILTFEMLSPKSQTRFTCNLNKDINGLEMLNAEGESGQISGELGKKDSIESLFNTVKMMCRQLSEDINSIPLNEEYLFHPCLPNASLIKLSDYLMTENEPNSIQSLQPSITMSGSCASSLSLSRHPSTEDISLPVSTLSLASTEPLSNIVNDYEHNRPVMPTIETQKRMVNELNFHTIVSSKCTCPISSESMLKVPEYIFPSVKQIIDKLINHNCKGLIILPQSNDILTRSVRILEIPPDHMFVGLPYADSSFSVIKGQKDKDYIIAKDTRNPDNVNEKCLYQKPNDGAVLLDSSGHIHNIYNPSLVIPPKPGSGNDTTVVRELPSELTHHKDQLLDCDQIVSVLQSLTHIQNSTEQGKDELFDSPVLLEPEKTVAHKTQVVAVEKHDIPETYPRRESEEIIVSQSQPQSQIQVERIFCEYVSLHKGSEGRHDDAVSIVDYLDRDLPKQQVRTRKISNESLESISTNRTRAMPPATYVNEADIMQAHHNFPKPVVQNVQKSLSTSAVPFIGDLESMQAQQKLMANAQVNVANTQKPLSTTAVVHPSDCDHIHSQAGLQTMIATNQVGLQNQPFQIGPILNQMPLQRMPTVPGSVPAPFLLNNPRPSNPVQGNIFIQSVPTVSHYTTPLQGSGASVVMSQSNMSIPVVIPNQSPSGFNYSHIHPTQLVLPSSINQAHIPQLHPLQQNPSQRTPVASTISSVTLNSSQLLSNMQTIPQNMIPVTQQIISNPVYPSQFTEQHSMQSLHPEDGCEQSFSGLSRPIPMGNVRQLPTGGPPQYYDPNMIIAENLRLQMKNQATMNSQPKPQITPVLIIPHQTVPIPQVPVAAPASNSNIKMTIQEPVPELPDPHHANVPSLETENKPKTEQIVGRFLIRPVTDGNETS